MNGAMPPGGSSLVVVSTDVGRRERTALDGLLVEVATGDHDAFASLYDAVAPTVFGICRRVLIDVDQSEEVTQEVMLEVWRTATRYDPGRGSATAWIAVTAHRRAVDRVRSSQSSRNREEHARTTAASSDPVAEQVEDADEHRLVGRALSHLTALQREAIELAYYGGRTYREVAAHLDVPLPTVKARMRDGLRRLHRELTTAGGDAPATGGQA